METGIRACLTLIAACAWPLAGCVYYPPAAPVQSYPFERHPGVAMEIYMQYDYAGMGMQVTRVVNRGNTDKCVWTQALNSRLLRVGEVWEAGRGQSPGSIGVANVSPADPSCVNAKRDAGGR